MDEKKFVLIDLERSIRSGVVHYWGANKRGYTRDADQAGRYSESLAKDLVLNDFDRQTVGVSEERFKLLAGIE